MKDIFEFHINASQRATIPEYTEIRPSLAKICRQLIDIKDLSSEDAFKIVKRLPKQIELFAPKIFEEPGVSEAGDAGDSK